MALASSVTKEQIELLYPLTKRKSHDTLKDIVKGIELDWFQTYSLAYALITKNCILSLDTGLGKTLIACGVMNWYKVAEPHIKWIYVCERGNYEQSMRKLRQHTDLKVVGTTAESTEMTKAFTQNDPRDMDCIVLTFESIREPQVNMYLFKNRRFFRNIIVDESHNIGNVGSQVHKILRSMCKNMEFRMFMTATPLKISPRQIISQYEILNRNAFHHDTGVEYESYSRLFEVRNDEAKITGHKNLDLLRKDIELNYVNFTRKQLGMQGDYEVKVHMCKRPKDLASEVINRNVLARTLKTDPTSDAARTLVHECRDYVMSGMKGIVYANLDLCKEMCMEVLNDAGLRVALVDGSTKNKRAEIIEEFNLGNLDVIVTNITAGIDLQCDFVSMFELSVDIKQLMGRAERGLQGNSFKLSFYITEETEEVDYFIDNIYNRGILLQEVCGKSVDELINARAQVT